MIEQARGKIFFSKAPEYFEEIYEHQFFSDLNDMPE